MAGFYGGFLGNEAAMARPAFGLPQPGAMVAGNPFGSQFVIPQRGIRGMTPAQVEELKQWDPQSAPAIDNIYRNVKPGGPQLPLAYSNGQVPMGNAGAIAMGNQGLYAGPQYGQQIPGGMIKSAIY
jgi:hypothetical protein